MNCPKCGAELPEGSIFCTNCGASIQPAQQELAQQPQQPEPVQPPAAHQYIYGGNTPQNSQNTYYGSNQMPPDVKPVSGTTYLVFSILATLFCCQLGIVGIIYAAKIDSLWRLGDYMGAQEAAKKAKLWTIITASAGIVFMVIFGIFYASMIGTILSYSGSLY